MWFDKITEDVEARHLSPDISRHIHRNRERIIYTIDFLRRIGISGKKVGEIGAGGIALACKLELGADVEAYDCSQWFEPVCNKFSIPWRFVDLNNPPLDLKGSYDIILLCEVIAHVAYWPIDILSELRGGLNDGGVLIITTQNLHRLSNRIRMLFGKRIFANFVPEELLSAHVREYTVEEIIFMLRKAGFHEVHWEMLSSPDINKSRLINLGYKFLCRLFPRMSNIIFCWAKI